MLSWGRRAEIQVSAPLCTAPACHRQASFGGPLAPSPPGPPTSLSAGIWAPPPLSWAWQLPPLPAESFSLPPKGRKGSTRGRGTAAVLSALKARVLPWQAAGNRAGPPRTGHWGFLSRADPSSSFHLRRENPESGARPSPPVEAPPQKETRVPPVLISEIPDGWEGRQGTDYLPNREI